VKELFPLSKNIHASKKAKERTAEALAHQLTKVSSVKREQDKPYRDLHIAVIKQAYMDLWIDEDSVTHGSTESPFHFADRVIELKHARRTAEMYFQGPMPSAEAIGVSSSYVARFATGLVNAVKERSNGLE